MLFSSKRCSYSFIILVTVEGSASKNLCCNSSGGVPPHTVAFSRGGYSIEGFSPSVLHTPQPVFSTIDGFPPIWSA